MSIVFSRSSLVALALAGVIAAPPARADAGHDHGDAPARAAGPGLPRFAAMSDLFELVGVVDGRNLTLYLDRAADNAPVDGAKLELEVGGAKVAVRALPEGVFEAQLAQPPRPGVTPVTATVSAGADSDLLAGELTIAEEASAAAAAPGRERQLAAWSAAGVLALGVLGWLIRRAFGRRTVRSGGAA
ncbi:MAG: hypothetical protein U1E89_04105 [Burkholderiaceae bacterium]